MFACIKLYTETPPPSRSPQPWGYQIDTNPIEKMYKFATICNIGV